ncbi:uncharacterized protein CEXT_498001 [Caerostris extrusa]|uniref:Uncharacterized protein n=1 Tax=Caerostris extrusa TaxID=172846 RepID=A0AAV4UXP6_CAEEX|nr:uncharacterized protein CEXT_498001 [Caerostris extrusa]
MEDSSEEKQWKYSLLPSLQQAALRTVAVTLWNQNIRNVSARFLYPIFSKDDITSQWEVTVSLVQDKMTEEQQMFIIQKYTISVIAGFLVWPWQDLFIEMATYFWSSIKLRFCDYSRLFYLLVDNEDSTGYNYKKLLAGFWCQSPRKYKNYLINVQCEAEGFLTELFRIEDEEHIRVILKNVTSTNREKLLLSETGLDICIRLVNKQKWCLLDTFLCECKLSNEAIVKFRQLFQNNLGTWYTRKQIKLRDHDWNKFYEWLDAFEVGDGKKRSIEYEEIFNAKKLCCEEPAKNNKGVKKNTNKIKKTRIPNLRSRSTVTTRSGTRGIPTTRLIVKKTSKKKKKTSKGQGE